MLLSQLYIKWKASSSFSCSNILILLCFELEAVSISKKLLFKLQCLLCNGTSSSLNVADLYRREGCSISFSFSIIVTWSKLELSATISHFFSSLKLVTQGNYFAQHSRALLAILRTWRLHIIDPERIVYWALLNSNETTVPFILPRYYGGYRL